MIELYRRLITEKKQQRNNHKSKKNVTNVTKNAEAKKRKSERVDGMQRNDKRLKAWNAQRH